MSEPDLIRRQRPIVRDLSLLAEQRHKSEAEAAAALAQSTHETNQELTEAERLIANNHDAKKTVLDRERTDLLQRAHQEHDVAAQRAATKHTASVSTRGLEASKRKITKTFDDTQKQLLASFESKKSALQLQFDTTQERLDRAMETLSDIEKRIQRLFFGSKLGGTSTLKESDSQHGTLRTDPFKVAESFISEARSIEDDISNCLEVALLKSAWLLWVLAGIAILTAYPLWRVTNGNYWVLLAIFGAVAVIGVVYIEIVRYARAHVVPLYSKLQQVVADGAGYCSRLRWDVESRFQAQVHALKDRYESRRQPLVADHQRDLRVVERQHNKAKAIAQSQHEDLLADARRAHVAAITNAEERFRLGMKELVRVSEEAFALARNRHQERLAECKMIYERQIASIHKRWDTGIARFQAFITSLSNEIDALQPKWDDSQWSQWLLPSTAPPVLRIGEYRVEVDRISNWPKNDARSERATLSDFTVPALLPRQACSILFKAFDSGRAQASQAIQSVLLRWLTTLPAGKVRLTIIDPVGGGKNFAGFMDLGDYDKSLVTDKIWTKERHIVARLTDLNEHIEKVIQKYLRLKYSNIEEYNSEAGEIAEPYRVLAVANFPVGFNEEAARLLVSIINGGQQCGVYTLIFVDTKHDALPRGFNLGDLEAGNTIVAWNGERFILHGDAFADLPLTLDCPPSADRFMLLLKTIGERAKLAGPVEVPFKVIAPPFDKWWSGDSRTMICVPIGRSGADRKQEMRLGTGTSQHVLVAGRTGSGKSTLLHALIVNLCLTYSPSELELYLIDFKKGVEFKTYARHSLPHARVVAIESEREFAVSVLQRLDEELTIRGDRFRDAGVQNLAEFRNSNRSSMLSRVLLVVDEFHEFFTEDDPLAREAASILDRLVRQGRAFGIHVLLGSQTLAGPSVHRHMFEQMAIRIALLCSEADSRLIFASDNDQAKYLSRPGEAIYNDAGGQIEGNNPFQVAWLSDEDREVYLRELKEKAEQSRFIPPAQIVFEGNRAVDVKENHLLEQLLKTHSLPHQGPVRAWLGQPIAIKPPTAAVFRRRSGRNLLIVGQNEEEASAVMQIAAIGVTAQHLWSPAAAVQRGVDICVLDGTQDESQTTALGKLLDILPQVPLLGSWRDVSAIVDKVWQEVIDRRKQNDISRRAIYFFVHGIQSLRELRKDDASSFRGAKGQQPSASKKFVEILQDGPGVGIHTLVWCDTLTNLNRSLERQGLREFEMRVAFQMSPTDSSIIVESPVASKLGAHRAILLDEDQPQPEKFRPYGLPSQIWLKWVGARLSAPVNASAIDRGLKEGQHRGLGEGG